MNRVCKDIARLIVNACHDPEDAIVWLFVSKNFHNCGVDWTKIRVSVIRKRLQNDMAVQYLALMYAGETPVKRHTCFHCGCIAMGYKRTLHDPKYCPLSRTECYFCKQVMYLAQMKHHRCR